MSNIKLFESKNIRSVWNEEEQKWYFSVVDVVEALTDSSDPKDYWYRMKKREKLSGIELSTICRKLKLESTDGKYYLTDCANVEGLLRIIQSIPSPKAEPFKLWLARVAAERLDEMQDPELTIDRAMQEYLQLGYSENWINQRLKSIEIRKELTDEWKSRGILEGSQFATLTDIITKTWSGKNTKEFFMNRVILLIVMLYFSINMTYSQTFKVLHSFDTTLYCGYQPQGGSIAISNDTIFGIATKLNNKIPNNWKSHEVIYKMHINGSGYEVIHEFIEKDSSYYLQYRKGSLTIVNNNIFGILTYGGIEKKGIIFRINANGDGFSLLHNFKGGDEDGIYPIGKLIYFNSVLYGMTEAGLSKNKGSIFSINEDGSNFKILHTFKSDGIDTRIPASSLILSDSILFGITRVIVSSKDTLADQGLEFMLNIDGSNFQYLRSIFLDKEYADNWSSIVKSDSNLYCVTSGHSNSGFLYKVKTDGSDYDELHKFKSFKADGATPSGDLAHTEDFIYGVTQFGGSNIGTIYRIKKDGSNYEIIHNFKYNFKNDGNQPVSGLVLYKNALYGTTLQGGKNNYGSLFVYRDVIIQDSCGKEYFNFPDFTNNSDIILNGNAKAVNSVLGLTEPMPYQSSSIYYKNPMTISRGFRTEFSFRFYNGFNSENDGSAPGADGIAFILQANSPNEVGNAGGCIGYQGIENSLVIEYDSYRNLDFNDTDGSHIGVLTNGIKANSNNHNENANFGTTSKIPILRADSTIYYSRIEYNYDSQKLTIWLDTSAEFIKPVIEINSINFENTIDLIDGKKAFVGFTSATGGSYQNTDILTWSFCPSYDNSILNSIDESDLTDKYDMVISPNPATDFITINLDKCATLQKCGTSAVEIYDMMGVKIQSAPFETNTSTTLSNRFSSLHKIDISHLTPGVYFVKIGGIVKKFVKY